MKEKIMGFVMNILRLHWIMDWSDEDAKKFCKLIFDGEGIEYQEEDFNCFPLANNEKGTIEIVKRYAKMYRDVYSSSDRAKAEKMNEVFESCNQMLNFSNSMAELFSSEYKEPEPEKKITIKPGESITFSNGAASSLGKEGLLNLLQTTFPEDQEKEEKPFTISFNASVSEEIREEMLKRISTIYEEVCEEMGLGKGR